MTPNRRMDGEIQDEIEAGFIRKWSAAQIERDLKSRFGEGEVPSSRTIQRAVKAMKKAEKSSEEGKGDWSLLSADAEDCELVLPVLKSVVVETEGRQTTISARVASLVVKIRRVAPDVDPWDVYEFARRYFKNVDADEPTAKYDLALAFEIWRGPAAMARFLDAVEFWGPAFGVFSKGPEYAAAKELALKRLREFFLKRNTIDAEGTKVE